MSLIERAVDKLGAARPEPAPLPERAAAAAAAAAQAVLAPSGVAPEPATLRKGPGPAPAVSPLRPPADAAPAAAAGAPATQISIPLEALRARGFVSPDGAGSPISQEFRVIKRPLLANAFGKGTQAVANGRRVMVTSAFPGEGKSFCAINLAMSIAAERDHQVLLVDADVARPSIPRELGIETGPGLMDWLIDGTHAIDDLVVGTNVDKLSLLPAGRRHEHATELLASDAMSRLLEQLSARFPDRIIIFDSPPLLITTESRVLASYMGQIVMVVEAGKTPRDAVKDALAAIGSPEVVGMILNKSREARAGSYYGYQGYGYGAN